MLIHANADYLTRIAPSAALSQAVTGLFVYHCERDGPGLVIPRPEVQLVARFGPAAPGGLDIHAFGARQTVHRKRISRGQRAVTARFRLGAANALLGVPAAVLSGRVVSLEELWGGAATQRLRERLAMAQNTAEAATILDRALVERAENAGKRRGQAALALVAAERLALANVSAVAAELGMSERHLRRVFRETIGVSPKAFSQLTRFHRALRAAKESTNVGWASIAARAGYYDQAHLIAEFRAIAGATPRALLGELGLAPAIG